MIKRIGKVATLAVIAVAFLLFIAVTNLTLDGARLDLTEQKLYSLTDGTREILADIDEPITLHFFFSEEASEDLTGLRTYAGRVRAMLEEYERAADGGINLRFIDPEPYSEEEDLAAEFGLQAVPVTQGGDELYFGLAGTNALDDQEAIAFFQPEREQYLEYELSKLIHGLNRGRKPRLAVYAELPVAGETNPATFEQEPAWVTFAQVQELFDVEMVEEINLNVLDYDVLLLVHPKSLENDTEFFALDQFVMQGGRLLVFMDPLAELDTPEPSLDGHSQGHTNDSNLNRLTEHWGVTMQERKILGDSAAAMDVQTQNGKSVRHLAIFKMGVSNIDRDDIVTASLDNLHISSVGIFDVEEQDGITVTPLVQSSEYAEPLDSNQFQRLANPSASRSFRPTGDRYPVAVRVQGTATTAYPDGIEVEAVEDEDGEVVTEALSVSAEDVVQETDELQVVLVADTDVLSDRLWVRVQNFFGQRLSTAFADNGSLMTNLAENLSGSNALISVRSRGQFTRPFVVVEEIRRDADARYRETEEELQEELKETERQLSELKSSQIKDGVLTLTKKQHESLARFQREKIRIRKELRDVRHQLDKDIENMGAQLKFANIVLMPLILVGLMLATRLIGNARRRVAR